MKWPFNKLSQQGFSIAEVMIALGAMSVVGLGFNRMMDQQVTSEQEIKARFAVNELYRGVRSRFLNMDACNHTFTNTTYTLSGTSTPVVDIRDRNNNILLVNGNTYDNGQIQVADIRLENISVTTTPSSLILGMADMAIDFQKLNSRLGGLQVATKKIPLQFDLNGSNEIQSCFSNEKVALDTAVEEACEMWRGVYNESTGECILAAHSDSSTNPDAYMMLSSQHLLDKNSPGGEIDMRYVFRTGGSMDGDLTVEGDITATGNLTGNNQLCVVAASGGTARCRNFAAVSIADPENNYPRRVAVDGSLAQTNPEKNVRGKSCSSSSQLVNYFDSSGNAICGTVYCSGYQQYNTSTSARVTINGPCSGNSFHKTSFYQYPTPTPTPPPTCSAGAYDRYGDGQYCFRLAAVGQSCQSKCSGYGGALSNPADGQDAGPFGCSLLLLNPNLGIVDGCRTTYSPTPDPMYSNLGCYAHDTSFDPGWSTATRRHCWKGNTGSSATASLAGIQRLCRCAQ